MLLLTGCNSGADQSYVAFSSNAEPAFTDPEHPGKALMEKNCYACHNPSTPHENRIAPPMIAVKMHYLDTGMSKEEFTNSMLDWTTEPSEEKAKMYGAVKRFGVMPYQEFPEETIRQISDYIYDNEIEEPDWFREHHGGMGKGMGQGMGSCSEDCSGNCKGHGKGKGMKNSRG